jgi:lipopolysaccharide export LptBFGC system permease protein LptF
MTILDRYIARSFLGALIIFTTSMLGLYMVSDAMFQLKDFSSGDRFEFEKLLNHYLSIAPQVVYRLAPFLVLMSAMFTATRMSRLGELVPVRAAGISIHRTFLPVFVLAGVIGLGVAAFQEYYVPALAEDIRNTQKETTIYPDIIRDSFGNSILADSYNIPATEMRKIYFHHEGKDGYYHVSAERAKFETLDGASGWRFFKGRRFTYSEPGRIATEGPKYVEDIPKDGLFIQSDATPVLVENTDKLASYLSLRDLSNLYERNPSRKYYRVETCTRLAYPLTFLVLLLIGLPCVLISETRNPILGIGLCLLVCLGYIIVFLVFTELGNRGVVGPVVAAGMPLLFFGVLGITLFDAIKT